MRELTIDNYTLKIEMYIDDMWFARNSWLVKESLKNWDIINHNIFLPILVENYSKDTPISFAPDIERYNMKEILLDFIDTNGDIR